LEAADLFKVKEFIDSPSLGFLKARDRGKEVRMCRYYERQRVKV
jgi:hypothetical protein